MDLVELVEHGRLEAAWLQGLELSEARRRHDGSSGGVRVRISGTRSSRNTARLSSESGAEVAREDCLIRSAKVLPSAPCYTDAKSVT